jgi:hypothetical protein
MGWRHSWRSIGCWATKTAPGKLSPGLPEVCPDHLDDVLGPFDNVLVRELDNSPAFEPEPSRTLRVGLALPSRAVGAVARKLDASLASSHNRSTRAMPPPDLRLLTCTLGTGSPAPRTCRIADCSSQLSPSGRPSVRSRRPSSAGTPALPRRRSSSLRQRRCGRQTRPRRSASSRASSNSLGARRAAMSSSVRATVVRGMRWRGSTSAGPRSRVRWTMPGTARGCRGRRTVTSTSAPGAAVTSSRHRAAADMWEATAPSPAASTAASMRCSVEVGYAA